MSGTDAAEARLHFPAVSPPPRLSVVVPVFEEEDSLESLHRELDAALAGVPGGVELLFVDDGSRDRSLERLHAIAAKDGRVRVLALDRNSGQSAALDAGFRHARGEIVATLDADLQNDPRDIPRLLPYLEEADLVNGVRTTRRDTPLRRLASRVANAARRRVTGDRVSDVGCSLRVMRAAPLRRVKMFHGAHRFLPVLLAMEGARAVEVPVAHRERRFGRSKYGIWDRLRRGLVDLAAVRWMQSRHLDYRVREIDAPSDAPGNAPAPGLDEPAG